MRRTEISSALFTAGTYTIDCKDDAIHTDGMLEFEGGTYTIDAAEGLEGTYVLLNDGDFTINASDDGINAGQKSDAYTPTVMINGGHVRITMAQGDTVTGVSNGNDGIDSNGNLYINGGTVEVDAQFPFDYDGEGRLNGGKVLVNGEEVSGLTNQTFGTPGGFGPGGQDFPNGDFDGQNFPNGDFDGQLPGQPPQGFNDDQQQDSQDGQKRGGRNGQNKSASNEKTETTSAMI